MHIILGQDVEVVRWDPKDGFAALADGTRYRIEPFDWPCFDPPTRIDEAANLLEVARLEHDGTEWRLDGQSLLKCLDSVEIEAAASLKDRFQIHGIAIPIRDFAFGVWPPPRIKSEGMPLPGAEIVEQVNASYFGPAYLRRWALLSLLETDSPNGDLRKNVRAAAWFKTSDFPLLLRQFETTPDHVAIATQNDSAAEVALKNMKKAYEKAAAAARQNLKEALSNWNRLDLPNVSPRRRAHILEAVRLYITNPEMHSLARVAHEMGVTKQCVSRWFKVFKEATGHSVVRFRQHESVARQACRVQASQEDPNADSFGGSSEGQI